MYLCGRTIFKILAKNWSQTAQVRYRSGLGSRCSLNMTTKRYKSKQSTKDYATSNSTTTVTVLEILNNMWKGFLDCFCVLGSLSNEETPLTFPWLRVLWRNKRKLYRKSTDQHCVRTDWLASLPMVFASVSKRVTVHNLSFDWRAWLPWKNVFFRRTQNWRRECGIRKHASVEHDSVINARARAVARLFESPFCPAFVFALFFYFYTRGQSELCDETITLAASKMSKSSGKHGGWQRKWVPTFLLQKCARID